MAPEPAVPGRLQDRVRRRLGAWRRLGAPRHVLRWLREGVRAQWLDGPPAPFHFGVTRFTPEEREWLSGERDRCLATGAWRRATCFDYVSRAFIVTHNGKRRLVIDFRHVNLHHLKRSCRFESLQSLRRVLRRLDWMISIDLKDAYHHVGVHEADQDYFTFAIQTLEGTEYFSTSALSFGWCLSPWVFTQIMRPVVAYLRSPAVAGALPAFGQRCRGLAAAAAEQQGSSGAGLEPAVPPQQRGVRTLPWLDDFACFLGSARDGVTYEQACSRRDWVFGVFDELGLQRNEAKGQADPSHVLREHLGYTVDSQRGLFLLTQKREAKLRCSATALLYRAARHRRLVRTRELASFVGLAQASALAVPLARCWLRSVYDDMRGCEWSMALGEPPPRGPALGRGWRGFTRLSRQSLADIREWTQLRASRHVGRSIWLLPDTAVLHSDAGPYGWGGAVDYARTHLPAHGFWTPGEAELHITWRELRAVRLLIMHFLPVLRRRRVLLYEDNQAVAQILTTLVSRSPLMMRELRMLIEVLDLNDISLRTRWLRSSENYVADFFSRLVQPREFRIAEHIFEQVQGWWGSCTVDAFAGPATALLPRFWAETRVALVPHDDVMSQRRPGHDFSEQHAGAFVHDDVQGSSRFVHAPFDPGRGDFVGVHGDFLHADGMPVGGQWRRAWRTPAEGIDAFAQEWGGECVWAHPPPHLLGRLAQLLRERPEAEAFVCAPHWPGEAWFGELLELATEHVSFPAGSLQRVAHDAPERLESWPVTVFRVLPRSS